MPLDFVAVFQAVQQAGERLAAASDDLTGRRQRARTWLETYANQNDALRRKVDALVADGARLRCALPLEDPLNARFPLPTQVPAERLILAVDGSQIYPDRHAAIPFGLINLGGIVLRWEGSAPPHTPVQSELLFDEDLYQGQGLPSEDQLSLDRDLAERRFLLRQVEDHCRGELCIALSDGPLELWGGKDPQTARTFPKSREEYQRILSQLREANIALAGYVDKPGANLVARLLEVARFADAPEKLDAYHPLAGVSDRWLFGQRGAPLLRGGERSAVFGLQSASRPHYRGDLEICFFYLNVGNEAHPWPVRVEIPAWVAQQPALLDALHLTLVEQARLLGEVKPYPYVLHRAHETALVTHEEKRQVEQMLYNELNRRRLPVDEPSAKQSAKEAAAPATRRQYP